MIKNDSNELEVKEGVGSVYYTYMNWEKADPSQQYPILDAFSIRINPARM